MLQVLHVAAMRRQLEVVECLLSQGLKPNPKSARGWTPLDEAVSQKDRMMVRIIQDTKASSSSKMAADRTGVKNCTPSLA